MVNVYAPQAPAQKQALWVELNLEMGKRHGIWVLLGDFNAVRTENERRGSSFDARVALDFNSFITQSELVDLQMGGRKFTWYNLKGTKMSRLDIFLVSTNFVDQWPTARVVALRRCLSDHCPIILKLDKHDYGPTPFRLFDIWMDHKDFLDLVNSIWNDNSVQG